MEQPFLQYALRRRAAHSNSSAKNRVTPPSSASTKKRPSKHAIVGIAFCPCPRFEYKRSGTLSLYAALNTALARSTAKLLCSTPAKTSSASWARWSPCVNPSRRFHIILDNLAAHKTKRVGPCFSRLIPTCGSTSRPEDEEEFREEEESLTAKSRWLGR